jgi:hypothetical protein
VDPMLDEFGLWSLIQDVAMASRFAIGDDCRGHLQENLVKPGNYRLRNDLNGLIEEENGPRATLKPLLESEWGRRWHRELVLLERPVAVRAASEILRAEAQLNTLRYVGQMMSVARQEGVTVLHEWSFWSAHKALCPMWPFC